MNIRTLVITALVITAPLYSMEQHLFQQHKNNTNLLKTITKLSLIYIIGISVALRSDTAPARQSTINTPTDPICVYNNNLIELNKELKKENDFLNTICTRNVHREMQIEELKGKNELLTQEKWLSYFKSHQLQHSAETKEQELEQCEKQLTGSKKECLLILNNLSFSGKIKTIFGL